MEPGVLMTADYMNSDVSVNDSLALLLGKNLWLHRREGFNALQELERAFADRCEDLELAQTQSPEDEDLIHRRIEAVEIAEALLDRAGELHTKLTGEIAKFRNKHATKIVITVESPDGRSYDEVMFSRQSLLDWAASANIKVGAAPHPTRRHSTRLLELLDELIAEFWEDHDPKRPPMNEAIRKHVQVKYGAWTKEELEEYGECDIPDLSDTVMKAMCTMMRPR